MMTDEESGYGLNKHHQHRPGRSHQHRAYRYGNGGRSSNSSSPPPPYNADHQSLLPYSSHNGNGGVFQRSSNSSNSSSMCFPFSSASSAANANQINYGSTMVGQTLIVANDHHSAASASGMHHQCVVCMNQQQQQQPQQTLPAPRWHRSKHLQSSSNIDHHRRSNLLLVRPSFVEQLVCPLLARSLCRLLPASGRFKIELEILSCPVNGQWLEAPIHLSETHKQLVFVLMKSVVERARGLIGCDT